METRQGQTRTQEAITDTTNMKNDIVESMNIILHESSEHDYRPIMENYKGKLRDHRSLSGEPIE